MYVSHAIRTHTLRTEFAVVDEVEGRLDVIVRNSSDEGEGGENSL